MMNDQSQPITPDSPVQFTDDEIDNIIGQRQFYQNTRVARGVEEDPDVAAHAVRLQEMTGVPATVISPNYDQFIEQQKKVAAQEIVNGNDTLQSYVMSHPLATTISNDDWANLDEFTRQSSGGFWKNLADATDPNPKVLKDFVDKVLQRTVEGGQQGLEVNDYLKKMLSPQGNAYGTAGALAATAVFSTADLITRAVGAVGGALTGAAEGAGFDEFESQRIVGGLVGTEAPHVPEAAAKVSEGPRAAPVRTAMEAARPFLAAGEDVPVGLHPEIDANKAKMNQEFLARLEEDLTNAASSTTRERSPELFAKLTEQMYGESTIGLHADAALALYGEKLPEAEDGLLGWVPEIESQLAAAREIGSDVQIPLKDWMARVDPAVAKAIRDDIRIWPGGVTAREAAELPTEPKGVVDEALPGVRAAAGLEPKFSIGDRKLQIDLREKLPETEIPSVMDPSRTFTLPEAHNYDILDENGKPVGDLQIIPSPKDKSLYVQWIGGMAGLHSNMFGPALVRDLKWQLKGIYPDYEYLTGHRVTGARVGEAAIGEGVDTPMPLPRVKLDVDPAEHQKTLDILQNGWERSSEGSDLLVNRQGPGFFTKAEMALGQAAADEIAKLTGGRAIPQAVAGLADEGSNAVVRGAYAPQYESAPKIFYDLLGPDPVGIARHESIHMLRDYGMFTNQEWSALEQAAQSEGWLDRYGIHDRYSGLDDNAKLEEAIAEGFREWAAQDEATRPKTGIGAIFQKIWDFLGRIRQGMGKYLGRAPTWEEVFGKTLSGEVGERTPGVPRAEGQFRFSVEDERKAVIEGMQNLQAASIGMDVASFKRVQEAIRKQADEDLRKATAQAEKQAAKRTSDEWRKNRVEVAKEVATEIYQRPDVAADLFVGSGQLYGRKLRHRFTLNSDKLTPEQKAALPDHYHSKSGLDPDAVAPLFGYSSGEDLVSSLAATEAAKNLGGTRMRTDDWIRKTVQAETDRRMEQRYGADAKAALDEARDSALSKSSLNVMHEELVAAAQRGGITAFDKTAIADAARKIINEFPLKKINSFRLMQEMGRHSRNAEKSMAAGDWAEAAVHMQRQTVTAHVAALAKEYEQRIAKFNKDAKVWGRYKYGKAASSMASDYANVIQQVLSQVGKKVQPTGEWLAREMQESGAGTDVRTFVQDKIKWGADIDAWPELFDPKKTFVFDQMKPEEFDRVDGFLRSLVHAGREEKRLYKDGKAFDFDETKAKLIPGLDRLNTVSDGAVAKGIRTVSALAVQFETYVDKLDRWDPTGDWNRFLLEPLFESEHVEMDRVRSLTKEIQDITKLGFGDKEIPSPFRNPRNGQPIVATRKTLWAAMLNQGTESNRDVFARSWGLDPDGLRAWIDSHATKEDWDGVQKIWDLFKKTGDWSDEEYRRASDRAMKREPPVQVQTLHGTYRGGYYPISFHPDFPGKSANLLGLSKEGLFGSGYSTGIVPGAGYRIERTGYDGTPLALDLNQVASRLVEQIHDGAMRNAIVQAAKILRDPEIKDRMIEKLGHEVYDGFVTHLRRIANSASPSADMSLAMQRVLSTGDYIRRNIISNMIGLNIGTIEKHGPTAFITSVSQLGLPKMLSAYKDIWSTDEESGMQLRKTIYEKSALMRGRQRYWQDSIYGSVPEIHSSNSVMEKFLRFREWSQWAATQPVALSDALSAEPLWWGVYKDAKGGGHDEGEAIYLADKAVRKAHGAGGTVGQPLIVNQVSKWFTPMYNFYNSVLNKAVESYWRAGEARGAFKEGDYDRMKTNMKAAAVGGFVALVVPTIIHDTISPPKTEPDDSWEWRIMKYIIGPMASFIPGGGNVAEYLMGSSTPDVGLQTAGMKQAFDFVRDLTHNHKHESSVAANQKLIRDGGTFMGFLGVGAGRQVGAWAGGAYGLAAGKERPRSVSGLHDMVRFGTVRKGD